MRFVLPSSLIAKPFLSILYVYASLMSYLVIFYCSRSKYSLYLYLDLALWRLESIPVVYCSITQSQ